MLPRGLLLGNGCPGGQGDMAWANHASVMIEEYASIFSAGSRGGRIDLNHTSC